MSKEIETLLHLLEISYCSNCELTLSYKQSQKIRNYINELQKGNQELKEKNENLTNMVCNKLIADYDYSSPLKDELNKTRVRNIVLKNANNETNKENELLKSVIDEVREVINKMIYTGYVLENNNTATQFMATNKNSEFGKRAEVLLQILDKGVDK